MVAVGIDVALKSDVFLSQGFSNARVLRIGTNLSSRVATTKQGQVSPLTCSAGLGMPGWHISSTSCKMAG